MLRFFSKIQRSLMHASPVIVCTMDTRRRTVVIPARSATTGNRVRIGRGGSRQCSPSPLVMIDLLPTEIALAILEETPDDDRPK